MTILCIYFYADIKDWHRSHTSELCSTADDCCDVGETVSHLRGSSVLVTPCTVTYKSTRIRTQSFPTASVDSGTPNLKGEPD